MSLKIKERYITFKAMWKAKRWSLILPPDWFMTQSANMLGKIHRALKDFDPLPVGIGESFFQNMTPQNAEKSYLRTLEHAKSQNNVQVVHRPVRFLCIGIFKL